VKFLPDKGDARREQENRERTPLPEPRTSLHSKGALAVVKGDRTIPSCRAQRHSSKQTAKRKSQPEANASATFQTRRHDAVSHSRGRSRSRHATIEGCREIMIVRTRSTSQRCHEQSDDRPIERQHDLLIITLAEI
jgi:hypothetical protein